MLDLPVLYLITKIMAVTASYLSQGKAGTVTNVISVLGFSCVFVLELLIERTWKKKAFLYITITSSIIACFILGIKNLFPLFAVLLMHLTELLISGKMYYQIVSVALILAFLLFTPDMTGIVITVIFIPMIMLARSVMLKLDYYLHKNEMLKEDIIKLESNITDLKELMRTLKTTISMEERNRIAARIHDEIGHGISGSIILLEAAMLQMKKDQNKAMDSMQKAVKNLRESVDEIRAALKEERTERFLIDIHDINSALEQFKIKYNITTRLNTSGDLSKISPQVWTCINDNLKECLTNVLKHSNATEFVLNIEVFNKIIKAEFKDNGKNGNGTGNGFVKHLGLNAIEERTAALKGRCFISKDDNGFCVTNIFYY